MRVRSVLAVLLLTAAMVSGGGPGRAEAGPGGSTCLPAERIPVTVLVRSGPGQPFTSVETDGLAPFVHDGRTVVPLRSLLGALAPGTDNVRWYSDIQTATFWHQGHTLSVRFPRYADRAYTALLDNKESYPLTSYLCNGRVWVTARTVTDAFRVDIQWTAPNVVMIDGAGKDPWAGTAAARAVAKCSSFPKGGVSVILSPIASARQTVDAFACNLQSY